MDHEGVTRVDESNVGIVTRGDIALAGQTKPLRRVPAYSLSHLVVGHAALASFAQHPGKQVLGAAKAGFGEPDIRWVLLRPFLLGRTAGVVADDPVDLAVEHGLP